MQLLKKSALERSVTSFGEISTFRRDVITLWPFCKGSFITWSNIWAYSGKFCMVLGKSSVLQMAKYWTNALAIRSHWLEGLCRETSSKRDHRDGWSRAWGDLYEPLFWTVHCFIDERCDAVRCHHRTEMHLNFFTEFQIFPLLHRDLDGQSKSPISMDNNAFVGTDIFQQELNRNKLLIKLLSPRDLSFFSTPGANIIKLLQS